MQTIYTKEFMLANRGCYEESKVMSLFFQKKNKAISATDILNSTIPLKDKY